ncbi:PREDICTED: TM2 domain-containing protein CG10795-like [Priapulus caudatus]|uniref:TM2 domain-containing protein CG10795-like n=1 Tax=Priapulus caudatus TaxID=37621 RepID=A0ABM1ETH6_PRICU|nr:PREDICTED: TM2 domain-containing protein CG10795-like [Priapulus caudatus]
MAYVRFNVKSELSLSCIVLLIYFQVSKCSEESNCSKLQIGQYICFPPEINSTTQQPVGCSRQTDGSYKAYAPCVPAPRVSCTGLSQNGTFKRPVDCKPTNGKSFETALLLSVFLGMFGIDRFYLGYPALGLLKFCTLGFMFVGQLVDIVLIATQIVGPADGSSYIIDYYGAGVMHLVVDNVTYYHPTG